MIPKNLKVNLSGSHQRAVQPPRVCGKNETALPAVPRTKPLILLALFNSTAYSLLAHYEQLLYRNYLGQLARTAASAPLAYESELFGRLSGVAGLS